MKIVIIIISLVAVVIATGFVIKQFVIRYERKKLMAQLLKLPPVKADFSMPEGAILCLQDTYPWQDIEAAVACLDFATQAKLYLKDTYAFDKELQKTMQSEITKTMEKSYRENWAEHPWIGWDRVQSFFPKREPYAEGIVVVNEVIQGPDGSLLRQRISCVRNAKGLESCGPLA
ncbi:MAG: hypothetical protein ABIV39_03965 [Verrucomicrobiota bacterium]